MEAVIGPVTAVKLNVCVCVFFTVQLHTHETTISQTQTQLNSKQSFMYWIIQ